jgi:hypothetical protein
MRIAAAGNVEVPAYLALEAMGYVVEWERETAEGEAET